MSRSAWPFILRVRSSSIAFARKRLLALRSSERMHSVRAVDRRYRKEDYVMYSMGESNKSLLKRLINRMAAEVEASAAGIIPLSDTVINEFKADCAMLTFVEENWS